MKRRLSPRLGPHARKVLMSAAPDDVVSVQIEVPDAEQARAVRRALSGFGADAGPWNGEMRLLRADLAAARLGEVAELPGVVYLEVAAPMRH